MKNSISPVSRDGIITPIKKAAPNHKGCLSSNDSNYTKTTPQQIVNSYYSANDFFRKAAQRKQEEITWYLNHSALMQQKAATARLWRDYFETQADEYLELMVMARLSEGKNV